MEGFGKEWLVGEALAEDKVGLSVPTKTNQFSEETPMILKPWGREGGGKEKFSFLSTHLPIEKNAKYSMSLPHAHLKYFGFPRYKYLRDLPVSCTYLTFMKSSACHNIK